MADKNKVQKTEEKSPEKPAINPEAMRQMLKLEEQERIKRCQAKIAAACKEEDCRLEPRMMAMNSGYKLDVLVVVNTSP